MQFFGLDGSWIQNVQFWSFCGQQFTKKMAKKHILSSERAHLRPKLKMNRGLLSSIFNIEIPQKCPPKSKVIGLFLDSTSCWFCNFSSHSSLNKNQVEDFLFENLSHASTTFTFTVLGWASSVIILGYQLVDYQLLLRRCLVSKLEGNGQEGKGDNSIANCHTCPEKNEVCGNLSPTGGLLHPSPSRPAILSGLNVYYWLHVHCKSREQKKI